MLYSVEIGKNVLILRGGRGLSQEELPTLFLLSLEEEQVLDMLRRGKAVMEVVPW